MSERRKPTSDMQRKKLQAERLKRHVRSPQDAELIAGVPKEGSVKERMLKDNLRTLREIIAQQVMKQIPDIDRKASLGLANELIGNDAHYAVVKKYLYDNHNILLNKRVSETALRNAVRIFFATGQPGYGWIEQLSPSEDQDIVLGPAKEGGNEAVIEASSSITIDAALREALTIANVDDRVLDTVLNSIYNGGHIEELSNLLKLNDSLPTAALKILEFFQQQPTIAQIYGVVVTDASINKARQNSE